MYDEAYYKQDTLEYCSQLDNLHQGMMIDAINDLREQGLSWEWINIAVKRKSINNWNGQPSLGLLFNNKYRRSVYAQLDRNRRILEGAKVSIYDAFSDDDTTKESVDNPIETGNKVNRPMKVFDFDDIEASMSNRVVDNDNDDFSF